MNELKFFRCSHCKNLIQTINNSGRPITCCGDVMEELKPNTIDAATEKHIPAVTVDGQLLHAKVGSIPHPMIEEHHITFLYLQTEKGGFRKDLAVGEEAAATFDLLGDKPLAVYEYCNLHGLWKADIR